jgi:hypothetical protein
MVWRQWKFTNVSEEYTASTFSGSRTKSSKQPARVLLTGYLLDLIIDTEDGGTLIGQF